MAGLLEKSAAKPKTAATIFAGRWVFVWPLIGMVGLVVLRMLKTGDWTFDARAIGDFLLGSTIAWFLVVCTVIIALGSITNRAKLRFDAENAEGIALLAKGLPGRAATHFEGLIARYRRPKSLSVVAKLNAGWARQREGQHARAIELLTPLAADKHAAHLRATVVLELTTAHALIGQLDQAAVWLAAAEALGLEVATLIWARALVAVRRGELTELARMTDASWRELESQLSGEYLRRLTLVRAFAVATAEGPRGQSQAEPLLARLRPATPGEFRWLTVSWPELGAFVATQNL